MLLALLAPGMALGASKAVLVAGGGSGEGIAVNNKTKTMTYMKMAEIQAINDY